VTTDRCIHLRFIPFALKGVKKNPALAAADQVQARRLQTYKLLSSEVLEISMFCEAAARKTADLMSLAEKSPSGTLSALSLESSVSSFKTCCISSWCLPRRLDLRLESGTFSTADSSWV
jgi:hypothetical protein